ncbi:hypothetical protein B0A48_04729 [Cryoendolithus antarcticus]|uniref:Heterokaryon incompatibility domain-containing protein n=1 Tax=Cryoendolithus antarcticus TaxID=1507870 RepID=A0A1V8TDK1_9PEZI|nr:hypothetical protein B0A48_04729 [Cryoendolithus antarcticus]
MATAELEISEWTNEELGTGRDALEPREEDAEPYALQSELEASRSPSSQGSYEYFTHSGDVHTSCNSDDDDSEIWSGPTKKRCDSYDCVDCHLPHMDASEVNNLKSKGIRDGDQSQLCQICRHINFEYLLTHHVEFGVAGANILLGSRSSIAGKTHCAFCRLVTVSIGTTYASRDLPVHNNVHSEDVQVYVQTRGKNDGSAVFDLEINFRESGADAYDTILIQKLADAGDPVPFYGRHIQPGRVDFTIVRSWVSACEHRLLGTGHDDHDEPQSEDVFAPTRLIDVFKCCISHPKQSHCRYIALSYVWGGPQSMRLLLGNEERLAAPNGLLTTGNHLPQTIHDAMEVTRRLGERYLWIDALCIVQDDLESKQAELLRMSEIYSHAKLTIFATHGNSVHAGLPGVSDVARCVPQYVEDVQYMKLANRLPTISTTVDQSVWNSRAWTFQERVLSTRKLYITEHQAMFVCPHTDYELCEDVHGSALRSVDVFVTVNESNGGDGFVKLRYTDPYQNVFIPSHTVNTAIYSYVVQQFCKRQMSYPADVLDAFSALSDRLTPLFHGQLILGLPINELDTQLLWQTAPTIERRVCPDTGRYLFPSWSWAGWVGPCAGNVAHSHNLPAFELQDSITNLWRTMDDIRGKFTALDWKMYGLEETFWQRGNETAFYYAHPIAACPKFSPVLQSNGDGSVEILPIRAETIKVKVTGAANTHVRMKSAPGPPSPTGQPEFHPY